MRNKVLFALVVLGIVGALTSAYVYAVPARPLPPAFSPAPNPYAQGIYANGIVESYQSNGENINLYPEVAGSVTGILVAEGQRVAKGTALVTLDDSIQRAVVEQQKSQAEAALALLEELRAQPRKETLEVAAAQVDAARAALRTSTEQFDKQQRSYQMDPQSVSKDTLDTAFNSAKQAQANVEVSARQYELTRAGAWSYDIRNQQRQYDALSKAYAASSALLAKYTVRAPVDGVVLRIAVTTGSYVSPQGSYGTYTQGYDPVVVMGAGTTDGTLGLRCYVDEILIPRVPPPDKLQATMFIRGTNTSVPLEFVRMQPYVTPKIELSNERTERVDLRVLPIVFRFVPPKDVEMYPGQLVDVYIGQK